MDIEKVRILDFFVAFPTALLEMRMPQGLMRLRSRMKAADNPYRNPVSPKRTFNDMQQVQIAALATLGASGFLDAEKLKQGLVVRTSKDVPSDLRALAEGFLKKETEIASLIISSLREIPTLGVNGLKDRSGLLEYRYDNV